MSSKMSIGCCVCCASAWQPAATWRAWRSGAWREPTSTYRDTTGRRQCKWCVPGVLSDDACAFAETKCKTTTHFLFSTSKQAQAVGKQEVVALLLQLCSNKSRVTSERPPLLPRPPSSSSLLFLRSIPAALNLHFLCDSLPVIDSQFTSLFCLISDCIWWIKWV